MISIQAQVAIVNQAAKRLPFRKDQRAAMAAAILTLQKLDNLRTKLVHSTEAQAGNFDEIAQDLVDILGLEAKPVVSVYGGDQAAAR